jgi:hypothetical protein
MQAIEQTPEHQEKLRQQVRDQILDYYTAIDPTGKFLHPPGHDVKSLPANDPKRIQVENDELHEFIDLAFDVVIPRKVVDPGHKSPFEFVADLFFERVKNAIAFANRSGGKTSNVAVLNFVDMFFKPGCEVASAGAVLDQANKVFRYFISFTRKPWFRRFQERYKQTTGKDFVRKNLQSWTSFANGSLQEVITGSEKGLRSPHPHKARLDEIDLLPWSSIQTALSMTRSTKESHNSKGIRGQNVFTSTRQNTKGSMQKLLDEANNKGIEIYEWNVWEILEKCTRRCVNDPEFGSCPIYEYCKGKAHHCAGFYAIDDFIDKVRIIDRVTWETEWLNLRPAKHKLVYYDFDNTRHIMTPERLRRMTGVSAPSPYWWVSCGLDFGAGPGHPFVYLKFCQLPGGQWLCFYEYYAEQRLLRDHATVIKTSPMYRPGEFIFADWAAQDRMELKQLGVSTKQAVKDVNTGIDYCRMLFSGFPPTFEPQLYVWYECTNLLGELGSYSWPTKMNGEVDKTGLPLKMNDHGPDAMRYALFSQKKAGSAKYTARTIPGI